MYHTFRTPSNPLKFIYPFGDKVTLPFSPLSKVGQSSWGSAMKHEDNSLARSGVQNLIKNEYSNILDVGCVCHLADLTVSWYEGTSCCFIIFLLMYVTTSIIVAKGNKSFVTFGAPSLLLKSPRLD